MENKFTPGPWSWNDAAGVGVMDGRRMKQRVAGVFVDGEIMLPFEEMKANAHLIASAPDLLAACEAALEEITLFTDGERDDGQEKLLNQLRRAIDKAKGE